MLFGAVQELCSRLTGFQVRALWINLEIDKGPSATMEVDGGVALFYWATDFVSGLNLLDQDRVRLWAETFVYILRLHGRQIGTIWDMTNSLLPTPSVKIGFLDRQLAVVDGCDIFLNLETGECVEAIKDLRPRETFSYDLGVIYAGYMMRLAGDENKILTSVRSARNGQENRSPAGEGPRARQTGAPGVGLPGESGN